MVQAQAVLCCFAGCAGEVAGLVVILAPALAADLSQIFEDLGIKDG
jgi:hypothetical protein